MSDAQRQRSEGTNGAASVADTAAAVPSKSSEQSLAIEDAKYEAEGKQVAAPSDGQAPASPVSTPAPASAPRVITVAVVGNSDVGLVREHNEDNYLLADLATGSRDPATFHEIANAGLLFAVCDGMGGAAAGEVASQMAVDTVFEMMRRSVPASDRDALARALVRAIEEAGARIFESARADRTRRGMGTTSTVAALMDRTLFVGQVGDSRAYILRGNELKQVTKDQSLVNQLIEAGQLTEDEAEAFEHSNIILQALGTTEQVSVDLTFLELRRGDRLLMCSDGLSGLVHGDVIREVMSEYRDLAACCDRLIELAKAAGGHDNVTVLLCDFGGEGLALPQSTDLAGYQQYPLPLESDGRPGAGFTSDVPTVAPPSSRVHELDPTLGDLSDLGHSQRPSGGRLRFVVFVLVLLAIAGAVYLWRGMGAQAEPREDAPLPVAAPVGPAQVRRVEVVVRTDVEHAELVVDGESYGASTDDRWVLDLPPGPHKLEARVLGSSVTSSVVTLRESVPATVLLSMPEGAAPTVDAGGAAAAGKATTFPGEGSSDSTFRSKRSHSGRPSANGAEEAPVPSDP